MVAISKTDLFLAWTASQGIQSTLDLCGRSDGRYAICKQDLAANDDLLKVPLSACICSDSLESLAERLAYERGLGSKSKFAPYLDVLPVLDEDKNEGRSSLRALPRFWDAKRLDTVVDGGHLMLRLQKDERNDIDPWALACVDSRANFLGDGAYSMTPMLDMINHDGSVLTRARIDKNKGFGGEGDILHLTSGKRYSKGDEAFISYGNLSNLDTLADYGFVVKNNPCNAESVEVRMMRRAPFSVTVYADGSIDAGSKATLRYYLANEEELEQFSTLDEGLGLGILSKPLSERNELDVSSFIASTIAEAADEAREGATLAEDDQLVSTYLGERTRLFDLGIERIKQKYPGLEY